MTNEVVRLSLFFILFVVRLQATNETTESSSEFDLSCNENNTCSTFEPELGNNITDDFYSTEKYINETDTDVVDLQFMSNEPQMYKPNRNIDFCTCDLQLEYCDINCCCDKNCTYDQKLFFSYCESPPFYQDPYYCYTSTISYENRTNIYWNVPEQRLFCILTSNLPSQHVIQLDAPIASLTNVENITARRHRWTNSLLTAADPKILRTTNISLKYDYNIWLYKTNAEFTPLMLPDKFTSNICVQRKPIRYLVDFISTCTQTSIGEENVALHPGTYYKDISIVSLPMLSNFSVVDAYESECSRNSCLPLKVFFCDETLMQCEDLQNDTNIKLSCHFSTFRNEQSCSFVTQKVRYYFFQNTNNKLTKVYLYLYLSNVTYFVNDHFELVQYFEVKFFWENYVQNLSLILSGNPGYISGKYILYGDLVTDNSNDTTVNYTISITDNVVAKNFLIFPKNSNGYCVFTNDMYLPIQFGDNLRSNCIYRHQINVSDNATAICVNLQKHIFHMWQINISRDYLKSGKFVGMYGNSNRLKISEWTEILYKFNDGKIFEEIVGELKNERLICKNIAQLLSVNIIYTFVDFKYTKNQPKILNVVLEPHLTEYFFSQYVFNESIQSHLVDVELMVEIIFYDTTKTKLKEYVNPPNLQFNFPHDFFYPFMMGSQKAISCNVLLIFCSVHVFIINYSM